MEIAIPQNKEDKNINNVDNKKVILFYGANGAGKTTFLADMPDSLIFSTDNNNQNIHKGIIDISDKEEHEIHGVKYPAPKYLEKVFAEVKVEDIKKAGYKTIIIDNIDKIFFYMKEYDFKRNNIKVDKFSSQLKSVVSEYTKLIRNIIAKFSSDFNVILVSMEATVGRDLAGQQENGEKYYPYTYTYIGGKEGKGTWAAMASEFSVVRFAQKGKNRVVIFDGHEDSFTITRVKKENKASFIINPKIEQFIEAMEIKTGAIVSKTQEENNVSRLK